jgi:NAD+ diphosphatase
VPDFPAPRSVDIALSVRSHERIGGRRTDQAWLDEKWADPQTRVLVLAGGRFPVSDDGTAVRWLSPAEAPPGERLLLGEAGGTVHFVVLPADFRAPDDWGMLRTVGPSLSATDAGLLVQAQALSEWHRANRYCPRCGGRLVVSGGGYVLHCDSCGREHFPRTDPAVIMLVTDGERALMGRNKNFVPGMYSTLAGFVEPGESLEDAVAREVLEETGIRIGAVEYHSSQPWPFPANIMLGFHAEAETTEIAVDYGELEDSRWFERQWIKDHVDDDSFRLPRRDSIARMLVEDWLYGRV